MLRISSPNYLHPVEAKKVLSAALLFSVTVVETGENVQPTLLGVTVNVPLGRPVNMYAPVASVSVVNVPALTVIPATAGVIVPEICEDGVIPPTNTLLRSSPVSL